MGARCSFPTVATRKHVLPAATKRSLLSQSGKTQEQWWQKWWTLTRHTRC